MFKSNISNGDTDFDSFARLLRVIYHDPVVNNKVLIILKMNSYPRRIVLSNWLEKLRLNKAPHNLTQSLTYLFDDRIAAKVYDLLIRSKARK